MNRRQFVTGTTLAGIACTPGLASPAAGNSTSPANESLSGNRFHLTIDYAPVNFTGSERIATAVNGSVPGPTLHWKEGEEITLNVTNRLAHDSSIHWHGMILPTGMDGVPGLSFPGIKPGETFQYRFRVKQNGTYWYHSHSGYQEQTGLYGAIVIHPQEPDPVSFDRDHVVLLSDWSDESPQRVYAKLKKMSHYYNFRERTAGDLWQDIKNKGVMATWRDRQMWNRMRMSDTDIADVTGYTYTYLMNGHTPADGWQGLFKNGEKVRLRFINGSAMTLFDVRIPGLKMTVVASDGQPIEPVTVDEFRIGVAETYDVIVEPEADSAYTLFAQSIDRSGYARGTLAAHTGLMAEIPAMDTAPTLGHGDMGMEMTMAGMNRDNHGNHSGPEMDHAAHGASMDSTSMKTPTIIHPNSENSFQVDMQAQAPSSGLDDPGIGLRHHQRRLNRRVLRYSDIKNRYPTLDHREPEREIQLHLTGNMHRYLWSFDGVPFSEAEPIDLRYGERVRVLLVNDTMMTHPIHLHGLWSELETGDDEFIPRKHTVLVQPGSWISYRVTADAQGLWAFHCHLMYHMHGMMRAVRVTKGGAG